MALAYLYEMQSSVHFGVRFGGCKTWKVRRRKPKGGLLSELNPCRKRKYTKIRDRNDNPTVKKRS